MSTSDVKKISLGTNVVYDHLCENTKRFVVEQGGTRSGKTYNIMMWLIFHYCQSNTGKVITIARKTSPSIIGTVLRDFINILMEAEMYTEKSHNKTRNEYRLNGNLIEFIAVDEPQKVRGRRRHVCFCNEANELSYEDFFQLNMRTEELFIIDFNPSDVFHWIYDELLPRKNSETGESEVAFFQTSYRDNPFLPESLIKEIEAMQYIDPDKWEVYGLGNRASLKDIVYTNWSRVDTIPQHAKHRGYGLDFGFSVDPTAMVSVYEADGQYYVEQILYEVGLTATDTAKRLKELGVNGIIYADNANPSSIEEIKRAGFRIIGEKKLNIREGIDRLKSVQLNITTASKDLLKEIQMYKWKIDRNGNNLGEPVGRNDHCFTGDTLIQTIEGLVPIKYINEGDYVATSIGWRQVLKRWDNGLRPLIRLRMQLGTNFVEIKCTKDHLIKTTEGWTKASELKVGQSLYLHKSLTGRSTIYTRMKGISQRAINVFTGLFGSTLTGRYPKGITFTTLTGIHTTIGLKTSHWCMEDCIADLRGSEGLEKTPNLQKDSKKRGLSTQRNGTSQRKVGSGIQSMGRGHGLIGSMLNSLARFAGRLIKQGNLTDQSTVTTTARLLLLDVEDVPSEMVYDLTVEEKHEYFANGILVHNCLDALRYWGIGNIKRRNYGKYKIK